MDVLVIGGIFREVLDADTEPRSRYGGSGLTSSVAAARCGARVALASYVGTDDERAVRTELEFAGVDDHAVLSVAGACGTFVYPTHQHRRQLGPMYRPAEAVPIEAPEIPTSNIVVAFGIPDFDPLVQGWSIGLDRQETVIWDRQGWLSRARDAREILRLKVARRIYLANEDEAIEDAQAGSIDEALAGLPARGFDVGVVKRGEAGVVVIQESDGEVSLTPVPAFPVSTNSTVGSGDVFAGAFAARLALGDSVVTAAQWGCAAAAISLKTNQNLLTSEAYGQARDLISG